MAEKNGEGGGEERDSSKNSSFSSSACATELCWSPNPLEEVNYVVSLTLPDFSTKNETNGEE